MTTMICEAIAAQMSALYACTTIRDYIRIRTPFLYPDGDVIDLYWRENPDGVGATISDLGETLRWLRMQSTSSRRTARQRQLLADIQMTQGVEIFRGVLSARVHEHSDIAEVVHRVSQAALRVSDVWFTFRLRSVESINAEVEEVLSERRITYDRSVKLPGRSERIWNLDFHTRTELRSSLICVLSTGTKGATRRITEHVVATWHDLSHLKVGPEGLRFVSLFDDTVDVWEPEEFSLAESLSDIARWSKPEQFLELVEA